MTADFVFCESLPIRWKMAKLINHPWIGPSYGEVLHVSEDLEHAFRDAASLLRGYQSSGTAINSISAPTHFQRGYLSS